MIKSFDPSVLESLAKILGDTNTGLTGSEIGSYLHENDFPDPLVGATKWKRLYQAFIQKQAQDKCANNIGKFIQNIMNPARHYDNLDWYTDTRYSLNQVLGFEGLELGDDGKLKTAKKLQPFQRQSQEQVNSKNPYLLEMFTQTFFFSVVKNFSWIITSMQYLKRQKALQRRFVAKQD